jgi:hypothetical protein
VIGKAVDLLSGPGRAGQLPAPPPARRPPGRSRARRWTSATPRPVPAGIGTRCCCGTGTASGLAGATSPRRPVRCTIRNTRPTVARRP